MKVMQPLFRENCLHQIINMKRQTREQNHSAIRWNNSVILDKVNEFLFLAPDYVAECNDCKRNRLYIYVIAGIPVLPRNPVIIIRLLVRLLSAVFLFVFVSS